MAPHTQTVDVDTICNAQSLTLAVPFGAPISYPESERAVSETVSAAIKRVDLDDDDDDEEDVDDFDEEGEEEDEFEDDDEDADEDDEDDEEDEDEDEYDDLDDEGEEEDDDVEPLSVKWRRAR
jgi:hypothetical protein